MVIIVVPKMEVIPLSKMDAGVFIRRVEDWLNISLTLQSIMLVLLNVVFSHDLWYRATASFGVSMLMPMWGRTEL